MTTKKILELVKDYYEMEYKDVQLVIARNRGMVSMDKYLVNSTLQRCLGVALFVQSMDVPYKDINELYEEYREKIEAVEKGREKIKGRGNKVPAKLEEERFNEDLF